MSVADSAFENAYVSRVVSASTVPAGTALLLSIDMPRRHSCSDSASAVIAVQSAWRADTHLDSLDMWAKVSPSRLSRMTGMSKDLDGHVPSQTSMSSRAFQRTTVDDGDFHTSRCHFLTGMHPTASIGNAFATIGLPLMRPFVSRSIQPESRRSRQAIC